MSDILLRMRAVKTLAAKDGFSTEAAEDLSQIAAVKTLTTNNQYQSNRHTYLDCLRVSGELFTSRAGKVSRDQAMPFVEKLIKETFEDYFEEKQEYSDKTFSLIKSLQVLDERSQRIIILYSFCGWTGRMIAEKEGVTDARISSLIAKAIIKLKEALK